MTIAAGAAAFAALLSEGLDNRFETGTSNGDEEGVVVPTWVDLLSLEEPVAAAGIVNSRDGIVERTGDQIGPYVLGRALGEGGMGIVFLAHQEKPVRRDVALKVIKAGMDTRQVVARFDAERQALALMEHPNIARVLDAGATRAGRPFFVMELVDGTPITAYCDRHRLTPRQRIEILIRVCLAIQHAHQKGIIHRDLKPSNVLMTELDGSPSPKVIDFGVAKAIDQRLTEETLDTECGTIVGTVQYMSPEQAGGSQDVDTRTDVYALGVLLFELLTGSTPLGSDYRDKNAYLEILRRVRDEDPPRPSTRLSASGNRLALISAVRDTEPTRLTRMVRGELDWVTMKALEKDRSRRYGTAAAFADDLRRYLDGDPVAAGPPSRTYRLAKLARKNRLALAMGAAFLGMLVLTTAFSAWQAIVADRAREHAIEAENLAKTRLVQVELANASATQALVEAKAARILSDENRTQAEGVSRFLVDVFRKPDPEQDGRDLKVVDLLDGAVNQLGPDYKGSPKTRLALLMALGQTYRGLGLYSRNVSALEEARRLAETRLGSGNQEAILIRGDLGSAYHAAGRLPEATALLEATLKELEESINPDESALIRVRHSLANAYRDEGRTEEAIALHEVVLKARLAKLGPDHRETLWSRSNLADLYRDAGRIDEAIQRLETVLKIREAKLRPEIRDTFLNRIDLALAYRDADRFGDAITLLEAALKSRVGKFPEDDLDTLWCRNNLGDAYRLVGRTGEAIAILEETLKAREAKLGAENMNTLFTRHALVLAYRDGGRIGDSIRLGESTLRAREAKFGPQNPDTAATRRVLAISYQIAGRIDDAVALMESAFKASETKLGAGHRDTIKARNALARFLQDIGQFDRAERLWDATIAERRRILGNHHADTIAARLDRADLDLARRRIDVAEAAYREILSVSRVWLGPDHLNTRLAEKNLLLIYVKSGDAASAEPLHQIVVDRERKSMVSRSKFAETLVDYGICLVKLGKWSEAEAILRERLAIREQPDHDTWALSLTRSLLGGALLGQGRFSEAEPLVLSGFEGLKARMGTVTNIRARRLAEAGDRIIKLYDAWGKADKSAAWRTLIHPPGTLPSNLFAH